MRPHSAPAFFSFRSWKGSIFPILEFNNENYIIKLMSLCGQWINKIPDIRPLKRFPSWRIDFQELCLRLNLCTVVWLSSVTVFGEGLWSDGWKRGHPGNGRQRFIICRWSSIPFFHKFRCSASLKKPRSKNPPVDSIVTFTWVGNHSSDP